MDFGTVVLIALILLALIAFFKTIRIVPQRSAFIVERLGKYRGTLEPGDVIFTGTSSGVAAAMRPPPWLKVGDEVRIEIEKVGYIEHTVVEEDAQTVIGDPG